MSYVRKTKDVWRVYVYYSEEYGYEEVCELDTRAEAKATAIDYQREGYPAKVKKCRVRLED